MNALITLILSLLAIGHATARLEGSADSFHRILAPPFCGDNDCKGSETCESCPEDCGPCVADNCGDGTCDAATTEDCDTCPEDCGCATEDGETCDAGSCISCGDGTCNGSEDCASCPGDCGTCVCGDGQCTGSEDCTSCSTDCGTCPNCADGQGCLCPDGTTCTVDGDCLTEVTSGSATCSAGKNSGLACTSDQDCPKGNGFATCNGGGTIFIPGEFGDCTGPEPHSFGEFCHFTSENTHTCDEDLHCGTPNFITPNAPLWTDTACSSHSTFPADGTCDLRCAYSADKGGNYCRQAQCMHCSTPMTCEQYCRTDDILGFWHDDYSCDWHGDGTRCDIYAGIANTQTINTGNICDTHSWSGLGAGSCNDPVNTVTITGALDVEGNCICSATIQGQTKQVWDSRCIENYDNNVTGLTFLPCSFTG